jgi:hypothetical protein
MKKQNIYDFYAFGYNYALLRRAGLFDYEKERAINDLDSFFLNLKNLELQVTQLIAENLGVILESIREGEDQKITAELAEKIKNELARLDPALDAELQLKAAYILTKKRYALDSLLRTPHELLANGVHDRLSDTAKKDYRLACTQIALSQATAAAFHLMRALEEQVKVLYFSYKKTKRLEKPMWGPMIKELREKRAPKPTEKLLTHLDGMRIHFRNPTQHPEMFYSLDEAQDLLNQTLTAMNMIHAELP